MKGQPLAWAGAALHGLLTLFLAGLVGYILLKPTSHGLTCAQAAYTVDWVSKSNGYNWNQVACKKVIQLEDGSYQATMELTQGQEVKTWQTVLTRNDWLIVNASQTGSKTLPYPGKA